MRFSLIAQIEAYLPAYKGSLLRGAFGHALRRSNRQKTEMMMGGFVGEMVLEGDLAPFEELLRICEVVHVGKGCVFGNGKIRLVINHEAKK